MVDPTLSEISFYDPDLYEMKIGPGTRVSAVYVPLAKEEGGPVLELGSGTGDVLFSIARAGVKCTGVDSSPAMLARSREKLSAEIDDVRARVNLVQGDMASFQIPERFRQVFFTNDAIGHLLTNEALIAALTHSAIHLLPGGRVVLDVSAFDVAYLARATDPWLNSFRYRGQTRISNEDRMNVWERTEYCGVSCRLMAHFRYERVGQDGSIKRLYDRILALRPRHPEEIALALQLAGFSSVDYRPTSRGDGDSAWLITARVNDKSRPVAI